MHVLGGMCLAPCMPQVHVHLYHKGKVKLVCLQRANLLLMTALEPPPNALSEKTHLTLTVHKIFLGVCF